MLLGRRELVALLCLFFDIKCFFNRSLFFARGAEEWSAVVCDCENFLVCINKYPLSANIQYLPNQHPILVHYRPSDDVSLAGR